MGILDTNYPATDSPGLLSPVAPGSQAQKWANALAVMSAGLKDAGAYLQHDPAAAGNVAALVAARKRQAQNAADPASYLTLLAGLARLAGAARPVNVPGVPLPIGAPPAALPLQNAPAQMAPAAAPQQANPISSTQAMPSQMSGWAVQKVR